MSSPAPIEAVIFDLGHTVWDFAPREDAWRLNVLRLHERLAAAADGSAPHPAVLEKAIAGAASRWMRAWDTELLEQPPTEVLVTEALADLQLSLPDEIIVDLTATIFGRELDMPVIAPDSLAMFDSLHASGIAMGCVSNTITLEAGIYDALARLGLLRYFRAVVASSAMGYKKPHPSLFQRALDDIDVAPARAVFVGDRLVDDIGGAHAAGMRAILTHQFREEDISGSRIQPDAVIRRLAELPTALQAIEHGEARLESATIYP